MKQEYLDKIKAFSSITITKICKDLNVNKGNLYNGNASLENTIRVWQKIEEEFKHILDLIHKGSE